jgi:hypothetical protein
MKLVKVLRLVVIHHVEERVVKEVSVYKVNVRRLREETARHGPDMRSLARALSAGKPSRIALRTSVPKQTQRCS